MIPAVISKRGSYISMEARCGDIGGNYLVERSMQIKGKEER
jgi:hypothetical protein